ncbi:MAG TPA: putative aminohydrolase SsnA [Anaerolineales bacterium]|nr:putative aminohydrolase SsnA [Anaerolineae bacterium]HIQ01478.1 putative aminohydrolase SsnA [Anaerolineales bacterium]
MLITHARVATLGSEPQLVEDGAVLIRGETIAEIGTTMELTTRHPREERWDAEGQLVMPAAICGHTHFYGAFARGMAVPGEPPTNFPQILERLWWRLDKVLTLEDVRYSALVCLVDAIRHGTTTLIDHHASPNAIEGSLDVIAEAVEQAGLRASLCYEVTDRDGSERARAGIDENVRFARSQPATRNSQLAASFGLHASLTLSDETLADCVAAASELGVGFHIHVAEDVADQEDSLRKSGKRVVHRLQEAGVLGSKTIAVHCVHVDEGEIEVLARTGTWVTHQPRSNMNNGVGVAPVEEMMWAGVRVSLGNDGFSNNMFSEMKAAYLVHKLARRDPRAMPGDRVMRLAYDNNAQLARVFWPDLVLAQLAPGAAADLVFLDYHPTTPLTVGNLPWHLLFGFEASMVTGTVCAGRVLMRDRQLLTLDEEAITARSRELAAQMWRRI